MAENTLKILEKRKRGEPLTLAEEMAGTAKKSLEESSYAAADFRVEAKNLEAREYKGQTVFVDFTQKPAPGDPARFEEPTDPWWGKPTLEVGRIVPVDVKDKEALLADEAKDRPKYVTDLGKKQEVDMQVVTDTVELQRRIDIGEVTPDNLEATLKGIQLPNKEKAAEKAVDGIRNPQQGTLDDSAETTVFPEKTLEWLKNYTIPANATM